MLVRLIVAAVIAVIISGFFQGHINGEGAIYAIDAITMGAFLVACLVSVVVANAIPSASANSHTAAKSSSQGQSASNSANDADREEGTVKWFNVSKGFGFITRENGDDIFVHYRSIRGQGRRRLFDGQSVSFAVVDSDKGLQADDVDVIS